MMAEDVPAQDGAGQECGDGAGKPSSAVNVGLLTSAHVASPLHTGDAPPARLDASSSRSFCRLQTWMLRAFLGLFSVATILLVVLDRVTKGCDMETDMEAHGSGTGSMGGTVASTGVVSAACSDVVIHRLLRGIQTRPVVGFLVVVGVYALATVLFVPGLIITLAVGAAMGSALGLGLGVLVGSLAVFVGATLGATLSFLLARYVLRDLAARFISKHRVAQSIDDALAAEGLRMVLLLRLSPAMPFNVMNFVSGTSAVRLRDFVLGSVGMLPAIVAYVYLGAAFGSGSGADAGGGGGNKDDGGEDGSHGRTVKVALMCCGITASLLAVWAASRAAKKQMAAIVLEQGERDTLDVSDGGGGMQAPAVAPPRL